MKILLIPQVSDGEIKYSFLKDKVTITINNITETFDFTGLPDGKLELMDVEGQLLIKTKLDPFPIISAEKKKGVLYLELLNWIDEDATKEERFPKWIDATDYVKPEEVVQNEDEGPMEESGTN